MFAPGRWRVAAPIAALVFVGPAIAAMFPLWLLGLGGYRLCSRETLRPTPGACLYIAALAAWLLYEVWTHYHGRPTDFSLAVLRRPELLQDYIVGALFAAQLVAFHAISPAFAPILGLIAKPIRWLAGATFTIYLFHLPIAQFLATQVAWPPDAWQTRVVIIGGTLALMFGVAEVTERRKHLWRRGFATLLTPIIAWQKLYGSRE